MPGVGYNQRGTVDYNAEQVDDWLDAWETVSGRSITGGQRWPQLPPARPWLDDAACREWEDIFMGVYDATGRAYTILADGCKAVCESCPVRAECLDYALEMERGDHLMRFGIFGGLNPRERGYEDKRRKPRARIR